ncbi:MAG: geranylgeranylglycerol-phosphate geranylgeranyltransferase [Candidatus Cloacimonadota bacterium]|nr:geranylgeranylglycerol-phosphate geranylgeranyltransferase [Candidatus Cloacimonadota bacterium]
MAFLRIIRPANCIFIFVCVMGGAYFKNDYIFESATLYVSFIAMLIGAFGYVINDVVDIDMDRLNRPHRVLPSNEMKKSTAIVFSLILVASGVYLATFIENLYIIYITILNSFLLFIYALSLKKIPLIGNLLVAIVAGSTFIFGGLSNDNILNSINIAIIASIFTLIREIVKDAEDIHGDSSFGAKTLPIIFSRAFSLEFVGFLIVLLLGFIIFLYSTQRMFLKTTILLTILTIIPMFYLMVENLKKINTISLRRYSNFIKIEMLVLLIITFFGER